MAFGDENSLGKRTGKDADHGKLTFPAVLGIAESRHRAQQLIEEGIATLAPLGPHAAALESLARYVLERDR